MQEDTFLGSQGDPLSLNLYSYCSNNPLIYWDPTGHWKEGDEKLPQYYQDRIAGATNDYNAAKARGDAQGMADAQRYANDLRDQAAYAASGSTSGSSAGYASKSGNTNSGGSSGGGSGGGNSGSGGLLGVNFKENEGADWLRTGSGLSFEEFWGTTPGGTAYYDGFTYVGNIKDSTSAGLWYQGTFTKQTDLIMVPASVGDARDRLPIIAPVPLKDPVPGWYTITINGATHTYFWKDQNNQTLVEKFGYDSKGGYVMLDYIVKKNGGSLEYSTSSGGRLVLIVKMHGGRAEYTSDQIDWVYGHPIIHNGILMKDFYLARIHTLHKEGDKFDYEEDAAIAFGLMVNSISIAKNLEYSAYIYMQNGKKYAYRDVREELESKSYYAMPNDDYGNIVATIHCHGAYDARYDSDNFSLRDRGSALGDKRNNYVVTPAGYLKQYKYSTREEFTITTLMPYDNNHPIFR
jgi:hypothetical protein